MPRPVTVFDRPQAQLLPDPMGQRFYGNVNNRMAVCGARRSFHVAVAVPTLIFSFMRQVLELPPSVPVSLVLDNVPGDEEYKDHYIFSIAFVVNGKEDFRDLWFYPTTSVPQWIWKPEHHC